MAWRLLPELLCAATLPAPARRLHEIFTPVRAFCTRPAHRRFDHDEHGRSPWPIPHPTAMIGWVILAAVLLPALALGRWAEAQRGAGSSRAARRDAECAPDAWTR